MVVVVQEELSCGLCLACTTPTVVYHICRQDRLLFTVPECPCKRLINTNEKNKLHNLNYLFGKVLPHATMCAAFVLHEGCFFHFQPLFHMTSNTQKKPFLHSNIRESTRSDSRYFYFYYIGKPSEDKALIKQPGIHLFF